MAQHQQFIDIVNKKIVSHYPEENIMKHFQLVDAENKLTEFNLSQRMDEVSKLSDKDAWTWVSLKIPHMEDDGVIRERVAAFVEQHNKTMTGNVFVIPKPPSNPKAEATPVFDE